MRSDRRQFDYRGSASRRTVSIDAAADQLLWSGGIENPGLGVDSSIGRNALDALVALGLPHADRAFDIAEVINFTTLTGLRRENAFWREHEVETGRRLARRLMGITNDNPPSFDRLEPRRFTVSLERAFAKYASGDGKVRRLWLPRPIRDDQLTELMVATYPIEARSLADRLEMVPPRESASPPKIGARYSFVAHGGRASGASLLGRHPWLEDREGEIHVTDRVSMLARDLAEGLSPIEAVSAFRDYLLDELCCGYVHYDRIGAKPASDWVLDEGWFDCRLGAALMVSLCRARRIPARLVGGYLLWEAPAEHYWMEAWLPERGWTPFDLLAWGLSAGGTDAAWRDIYAGWTDYRMKTQIFPRVFTGGPGAPMPRAIHRLHRRVPGGTEINILDAEDGREIYTDTIRITA